MYCNDSQQNYYISRYGIITAVKTVKAVPKGTEFLTYYGYQYKHAPLWYKQLFKKSMKKDPELKKHYPRFAKEAESCAETTVDDEPLVADAQFMNVDDDDDDVKEDLQDEQRNEPPVVTKMEKPKVKNLLGTTYWY